MNPGPSILGELRSQYHQQLQQAVWRYVNGKPTNADKDSDVSVRIASGMLEEPPSQALLLLGRPQGRTLQTSPLFFFKRLFPG
jgi:hypothetical protein